MQKKPTCFFCGLQSDYLPSISGQDLVGISCRRCGNYYLDGFLAECGAPNEENEKKILRGYARWEYELRNSAPIITADRIETVIRDNRDYSDEMKVDKLLLYYSRKYPDKGSDVEFISDIDYPITFSKNSLEYVYLLAKVADEHLDFIKLLSTISGGQPEGYFRISRKGWERIDLLKKMKFSDDKYKLEKEKILCSLQKAEMELKEQAGLKGTRFSSMLARELRNLYLQGSYDKLDKRLQVDREILFGGKASLDKKELNILREYVNKLAEFEKDILTAKISKLYRDCHTSEGFYKKDIVNIYSEIDTKLQSISIDLEVEGLPRKKSRPAEFPEIDIEELIKMEESSTLEFKSTFQWDARQGRENKELRREVVRTLAAFNNTKGGYLVIGVSNDKSIYGLEKDYSLIGHPNKRDFFLQTLCNVIEDSINREFVALIGITFYEKEGKDICRIKVNSGNRPVFVKESNNEEVFYIRTQNSMKKLSPSQTLSYVGIQWK